ncbi:hypothetical protein GEMRC1_004965 [Eukaryota sp. GEM-RC1]
MPNSSPSPPVSGVHLPSPPSVANVNAAPADNLVVDPASFDGLVVAFCEQPMDGFTSAKRQQWKELVYSTENAFQTMKTELFELLVDYPGLSNYLINLLKDVGPKFLGKDRNDNFNGQVASSRVESLHSVLKRYLKVSTGNLLDVCLKMKLLLTNISSEYEILVVKDLKV